MGRWIPILAQAFPGQIPPSGKEYGPGDLSFLRFPEGSPEQIKWFFIVIMGIAVVVVVTLVVERFYSNWSNARPRRNTQKGARQLRHMEPELQAAVNRLVPFAGGEKGALLVQDVSVFESAVHQMIAAGQDHDLLGITKLRRHLHMTVMNSNIEIVSTRQLMADLPVRIVASLGTERVDLYCSLLEVNERFLLIDLPYQQETYDMLTQNPEVLLLYWRQSGERPEAPFRVRLEPIQAGQISAFRCAHALVSEEMAQRSDFRLTVDLLVTYQFVSRDQLVVRKQTGQEVSLVKGEARLIDLSQSGAAFLADLALSEGGFAQVTFALRDTPIRMMLEVLDQAQREDGKYLVRGHFRGMSQEMRARLQNYLSREQIKRLQLKEAFVQRTTEAPPSTGDDGQSAAAEAAAEAAALQSAAAHKAAAQGVAAPSAPASSVARAPGGTPPDGVRTARPGRTQTAPPGPPPPGAPAQSSAAKKS